MSGANAFASGLLLLGLLLAARPAAADQSDQSDPYIIGFKIRIGGRFDNVRKCVASPQGTPGGPAADISAFVELPAGHGKAVDIDLPVMRPVVFASVFHMLQFEPSVTLKFKDTSAGDVGWVVGPTLGVSLHYGPDYHSDLNGPKFFAMGPIIGGYAGLDFRRPGKDFNFELGVTPYVIPLFGISDPAAHRGVVLGGLLDSGFRFAAR